MRARGAAMAAALCLPGCGGGFLTARETLADPLMRFDSVRPAEAPTATAAVLWERPLPTDALELSTDVSANPSAHAESLAIASQLRSAVEVFSGFGLEAGYQLRFERERLFKIDGFYGPLSVERLRHGPGAALVYDDGTSVLRLGYAYASARDGDRHEVSLAAQSLVLASDTGVELTYRRTFQAIDVQAADLPAADPVDDSWIADRVQFGLEQGLAQGLNLRLDVEGVLEEGFLQSPYRLVTLWPHRPPGGQPQVAPQALPERHPASRARIAGLLRARIALRALRSSLEFGAGHGTDSWRVEHSRALLGFHLRLTDELALHVAGGFRHQTRALFYRDDYKGGPVGSYWSADLNLCSAISVYANASLELQLFAERGPIFGIFRSLNLAAGMGLVATDTNFEGLASDNGFTWSDSLVGARAAFEGGSVIHGSLALSGTF